MAKAKPKPKPIAEPSASTELRQPAPEDPNAPLSPTQQAAVSQLIATGMTPDAARQLIASGSGSTLEQQAQREADSFLASMKGPPGAWQSLMATWQDALSQYHTNLGQTTNYTRGYMDTSTEQDTVGLFVWMKQNGLTDPRHALAMLTQIQKDNAMAQGGTLGRLGLGGASAFPLPVGIPSAEDVALTTDDVASKYLGRYATDQEKQLVANVIGTLKFGKAAATGTAHAERKAGVGADTTGGAGGTPETIPIPGTSGAFVPYTTPPTPEAAAYATIQQQDPAEFQAGQMSNVFDFISKAIANRGKP